MKSIVFVESNFTGIDAMRSAKAKGYRCILFTSDIRQLKSLLPHCLTSAIENEISVVTLTDTNNVEVLERAVQNLGFHVSAVITFSQFRVQAVAELARRLGLRGCDPGALAITIDKYALRESMRAAGIAPVCYLRLARNTRSEDVIEKVGLPCIFKPARGHSSLGVTLVPTEADLDRVLSSHCLNPSPGEILVEEFLSGPLYSLETITYDRGRHLVWGWSDRLLTNDFIEIGATFPSLPPDSDRAAALVFQTLDSIGFDFGACHTELIFSPKGPRIVEINPRPAGSGLCRLIQGALGHDVVLDFVEMHLGEPTRGEFNVVSDLTMRSILPDVSGRILRLPSPGQAMSLAGVRDVWFQRKVGDLTDDSRSNFSWILSFIAESAGGLSSKQNASRAVDALKSEIQIAPARGGIRSVDIRA